MCGRVQLQMTWEELAGLYSLELWTPLHNICLPLFNIAPTQALLLVVVADAGRALQAMRWGPRRCGWTSPGGVPRASMPRRGSREEGDVVQSPTRAPLLGTHERPLRMYEDRGSSAGEMATAQQHFMELCEALNVPRPSPQEAA